MKIFKYIDSDIDKIKFNKWAWHLKNSKSLKEMKAYLSNVNAYTIYKEKPIAILAFHEYDKDSYYGCIVADESFGQSPKDAIKMRYLLDCVAKEFKMKEMITLSEDDENLNKWHEFLGGTLVEKHCEEVKGRKLNKWSRKWEWKQH